MSNTEGLYYIACPVEQSLKADSFSNFFTHVYPSLALSLSNSSSSLLCFSCMSRILSFFSCSNRCTSSFIFWCSTALRMATRSSSSLFSLVRWASAACLLRAWYSVSISSSLCSFSVVCCCSCT